MSRLVPMLLSAWLGAGILFSAVVAPAAFAVLPSRTLAGTLVGRVLPVRFISGIIVAAVSRLVDRGAAVTRPRVRRLALGVVMVACGVAQFGIGPRIERTRAQIQGPIEQLSRDDPRRVAFGRLHALSVGWLGLAMLGAVTTVLLSALSPRTNRTLASGRSSHSPGGSLDSAAVR